MSEMPFGRGEIIPVLADITHIMNYFIFKLRNKMDLDSNDRACSREKKSEGQSGQGNQPYAVILAEQSNNINCNSQKILFGE
jgi:hypothetical protein